VGYFGRFDGPVLESPVALQADVFAVKDMLYQATHTTRYRYEAPVSQSLSEARLTPRSFDGQTLGASQNLKASRIRIDPEPVVFQQRTDYFGNEVTTFAVVRLHDRLVTTATSVVEVTPCQDVTNSKVTWEEAKEYVEEQPDEESLRAFEFVFASPFVPLQADLFDYAKSVFRPGAPLVEAVWELTHRIHKEFKYAPATTTIDTPLSQVLREKRGVCQDFAHLMIGALRSHRIAARYVSGYLRSGANYQGAEASHAWVSVFAPEIGWVSFDPTNDVMPSDGHVTLAWGRDYGDVTPLKGITLGGAGQTIEVEVRVDPLVDPVADKPSET
jgi:transglutaminase-like putative cysteine protease